MTTLNNYRQDGAYLIEVSESEERTRLCYDLRQLVGIVDLHAHEAKGNDRLILTFTDGEQLTLRNWTISRDTFEQQVRFNQQQPMPVAPAKTTIELSPRAHYKERSTLLMDKLSVFLIGAGASAILALMTLLLALWGDSQHGPFMSFMGCTFILVGVIGLSLCVMTKRDLTKLQATRPAAPVWARHPATQAVTDAASPVRG